MKRLLIIFGLLVAAVPAAAQNTPTTDERQAVLATVDGLFAAMLARDGAAVTALPPASAAGQGAPG